MRLGTDGDGRRVARGREWIFMHPSLCLAPLSPVVKAGALRSGLCGQALSNGDKTKEAALGTAIHALATGAAFALALGACADRDNPTALADLSFDADFELSAAEVQTFEAVEVHAHPHEDGHAVIVMHAELEIHHEASGEAVTVPMEVEGDGYAARVMFSQPGAYHLHMLGIPHQHTLQWEIGETDIDVVPRHETIGSYWVELFASPTPVFEHTTVDLHFHVYDLLPDDTPGSPAGGLTIQLEIHAPDGSEEIPGLIETAVGEYEATHTFGEAGEYELHVEIETGTGAVSGEFHFPVTSPEQQDSGQQEGGGHAH